MKEQQQSPEPWTLREASEKGHFYIEGMHPRTTQRWIIADVDGMPDNKANAERIVACVNACAGLSDPAAAIQAAREALETALQYESESYRPSSSGRREEMAEIRAALQQLNGEAQP